MRPTRRSLILLDSMLVKVQLLRHSGERLPASELRSRSPLVGWIRLYGGTGMQLDRADRVAVLQLPEGRLLELYDAQLVQWDGRGLILSGEERTVGAAGRRFERHRQAWWCRPIEARDAAAIAASPQPLAMEDATESEWINALD
jgi:hypothetical protein